MELEKIGKAALFVFSKAGFTEEALNEFEKHGIARSDDGRWRKNQLDESRRICDCRKLSDDLFVSEPEK